MCIRDRLCASVLLQALVFSAESACTDITPEDALFIVDTQNSFIEEYPIGASPQYPIPDDWKTPDGSSIKPGALAVGNSSQIIDGINSWIDYFTASNGRVFASLDWHPTDHCSFCRNGTASTNPSGFHPEGGVCAALPVPGFNDTGRCQDRVAQADYAKHALTQWPDHCVQSTFGARFSPFLRVPPNATVVKKGWGRLNDTYSAFGGTQSLQAYPFDTQDSQQGLQHRATLTALLEQAGVRRMWVVGLATDFCVGGTVLDALGANPDTGRPKPAGVEQVVLVEPCVKPVSPEGGATMIKAITAAGGVVASHRQPQAAIQEVCARPGL
eukprot:TRINITY_DN1535_c0_g1_i1.p1 TRINITY_DN1535_c0_g1~~TRINITY_DN1535_c0_g1_i1.p1  ORF type:complete len:327 (-),score=64.46 TRINITY_DN1535_c0_g1_i1:215-1195(-)